MSTNTTGITVENEFFLTRRPEIQNKNPETKKYPKPEEHFVECMITHPVSHHTLLAHKKQQIDIVNKELDEARKRHFQRLAQCEEANKALEMKKVFFQEQMDKFEKFMSENEKKRSSANTVMKEQVCLQEKMEVEKIEKLSFIQSLEESLKDMHNQLNLLSFYQNYLSQVVEYSDIFSNIPDVICRYVTLSGSYTFLDAQMKAHKKELNELRAELNNMQKENQNQALMLNSLLASKNKEHEQILKENADLEQHMYEKSNLSIQQTRSISEMTMSITNIFDRINPAPSTGKKGENKATTKVVTPSQKVKVIKQILLDMQDILDQKVPGNSPLTLTNKRKKK